MAERRQPIGDSAHDGLGFSMVMYTTVVSAMPFPQFWAVLLFIVFICLGLDTQFATLEVGRARTVDRVLIKIGPNGSLLQQVKNMLT